ncbi:MAG: TraR/DksA C4-type zinc finger protein [Candidatus Chisholmbacteria bacterium]|nr:TraR/DksA C4-type zinc finger protein [Candidatus Chisholmbacteria bacterium]
MKKNSFSFPMHVLGPIRDYLVKRQRKLERRQVELLKEDPFTDEERVNNNASLDADAAEITGHERVAILRREVDKGLIEIRKALTRVKLGKYGLCARCGRMIDTDRLAIDPAIEWCVDCQKEMAKNGKD